MATLFITPQYVKEASSISGNIEDKKISAAIRDSAYIYVHQILGTDLFNDVITKVNAGTVSGDTETLLENYIAPCLLHYTLYELMPFINYPITNKNISHSTADNSTPSSMEEIKFLRANEKEKAEFFAERLTKYLVHNDTLFPLYRENTTIDKLQPNKSSFFSGIYLRGTNNDCSGDDEFGTVL